MPANSPPTLFSPTSIRSRGTRTKTPHPPSTQGERIFPRISLTPVPRLFPVARIKREVARGQSDEGRMDVAGLVSEENVAKRTEAVASRGGPLIQAAVTFQGA